MRDWKQENGENRYALTRGDQTESQNSREKKKWAESVTYESYRPTAR